GGAPVRHDLGTVGTVCAGEPGDDGVAVAELDTDPAAVHPFGHGVGGPAPSERVKNQVPFGGADRQDPLKHLLGEGVGAPVLRGSVPHRRDVGPDIGHVHAFGVHLVAVPAVVLHLTAAVPAQ